MKNVFLLFTGILTMALLFSACQQTKPMDDATIMMKADSIANSHMVAIADSMKKECETNSAATIKMLADSMYAAQTAEMAKTK